MVDQPSLDSFRDSLAAVVVGANGGLGAAFADLLARHPRVGRVTALSRREPDGLPAGAEWHPVDLEDEAGISKAAEACGEPDLVLVATGILHGPGFGPEKSWRDLDAAHLARSFRVNAIGPALVARHLLPRLPRDRKACFAALSARVGSIADNRIGGWYGYRASKAALNQLIRTLAIELARKHPQAVCVGLHPGTVDTALSAPFQANVPTDRLFAPNDAAARLLAVLDRLDAGDSGACFDWAGDPVAP